MGIEPALGRAAPADLPLTICLIQPFDPRGRKIGGIESHIRETIRAVSQDLRVVLIGIDEVGDLRVGVGQEVEFEERVFTFVPLLTRTGDAHLSAARSLFKSLTLQFFMSFLRHVPAIRRVLAGRRVSAEIERFEFASFGRLLGVPTVQIVHGEGSRDQPMDSLLKRYWFTHQLNEQVALRLATRVVGVNPRIVERIGERFPFAAGKASMMTVSVNTGIFAPPAGWPSPSLLRIGFAGRLDAFKRPDLMMMLVAELSRRLDGAVEFHYIGGSDPAAVPGYAAVRANVVAHGTKPAREVAALLGGLHAGILCSDFEGMPVYVLELLATGRPLVALDLPQLGLVVEEGVSGTRVPRGPTERDSIAAMAQAVLDTHDRIVRGAIDPAAIRAKIMPYSHTVQTARMLDLHRAIAVRRQR